MAERLSGGMLALEVKVGVLEGGDVLDLYGAGGGGGVDIGVFGLEILAVVQVARGR